MIAGLGAGIAIGLLLGLAIGLALHFHRRTALLGDVARLQATVEQASQHDEERGRLAGTFSELSAEALRQNNEQFLFLAETRLSAAQESARSDLGAREQAIAHLLEPLTDLLARYDQSVHQLEVARKGAYGELAQQVKHMGETSQRLQRETQNLATALRAPQSRGRWGEFQLRRVVEMAGMVPHCDFNEQVSVSSESGRIRPDLVVHLPGDASVVVDAKVPLDAYLRAVEATDDATRRSELQAHARTVRAHVDALGKKQYWSQFEDSPEWVVAFVPGDQWLSAAFEYDPTLLEHAVGQRVLLASPITLIALLHAFASTWKQSQLADNARAVQKLGAELYDRLRVMGGHLSKLQKGLSGAVRSYNDAIGSLETRVLVTARRFPDLGVQTGANEIDDLEPITETARAPQAELFVLEDGASANPGLRALRPAPSEVGEPGVQLG